MQRHLHAIAPDTPAAASVRVVLAEDHEAMRRNLRLLLDGEGDIEVVAEVGDLPAAIGQVHKYNPPVLVLDLRMHGESSIETIRLLRARAPHTEIVVITMQDSQAFAKFTLDAGAVGYVLKDTADIELAEAVRRAAGHEVYTSPRIRPVLTALVW